jgi:hypothetical protein
MESELKPEVHRIENLTIEFLLHHPGPGDCGWIKIHAPNGILTVIPMTAVSR